MKNILIFSLLFTFYLISSCSLSSTDYDSNDLNKSENITYEDLKEQIPIDRWQNVEIDSIIYFKSNYNINEDDAIFYGKYETIGNSIDNLELDKIFSVETVSYLDRENTTIDRIDLIVITSSDPWADTDGKIYFQMYGTNDVPLLTNDLGLYGKQIDTQFDDYERNRADRFSLSPENHQYKIKDLTRFQLTNASTDGWKVKGAIIIINRTFVVFSNMNIYHWLDQDDIPSRSYSITENIEFLGPGEVKKLNETDYLNKLEVITTTSNLSHSGTDSRVYIKLKAGSYYLLDTTFDDFVIGRTEYFPGITSGGFIGDNNQVQFYLPSADDWTFRTVVVLMNDKIVYYRDNLDVQIGDDGGYYWTDPNLKTNIEWNGVIY
ncbi:MAG: hypothetical protein AB7W47_15915 [Calditrichaceae bacterium]